MPKDGKKNRIEQRRNRIAFNSYRPISLNSMVAFGVDGKVMSNVEFFTSIFF